MSTLFRTIGLLGVTLGCAACNPHHYLDRRETVSLAAGDAVHANMVTHIANPWPRRAFDRRIEHDGQMIQQGVDRLRTGKVYDPTRAPGGIAERQGGGTTINIGGGTR